MGKVINPVIVAFVITLLCGCGTIIINPSGRTDNLPSTTKHRLYAGVYYSPQFAGHQQVRASAARWAVAIGAASVKLFDDIFPRLFEKVSPVSTLSVDELSSKGVDVMIAPTLEHFDFRTGMDADSDRYSVAYRVTLYTNRGVPASSWVVSGNAPSKSGWTVGSAWNWIDDDMTDAAVKFLAGFESNAGPALAAIAKSKAGQRVPIDMRNVVLTAKGAELPGLDPDQAVALQKAGVVTVQVTVKNQAERGVVVRGSDMRLRLKDGQVVEPTTTSSVLSELDRMSQTGPAVAVFLGPLLGVLASIAESQTFQAERELQLKTGTQSLFADRTPIQGKEETGIVFFRLPKRSKGAEGATLTAWVVDPASAEGSQTEVPLFMAQ